MCLRRLVLVALGACLAVRFPRRCWLSPCALCLASRPVAGVSLPLLASLWLVCCARSLFGGLPRRRAFWLVVLYRDANGDHDVILPRGQYKAYHAEGERVALPDMTSTNLEGETSTLETLVVYGFADEADFRRFVPPQGKITAAQANTYASDLQEALDNRAIPPARWSRAEFTFEILAGQ